MALPARIGRYRVLDRLGQGAMGTVYRCRDEALERDVAVKVLSAENADAGARARFAREARAAARLQHPNIVTIYELGEHESGPFMVLELLEGLDLQRAIEAGIKPDPRFTLPVVLQLLAGLAHAHDAGIVHRDVKPSNVFLPRRRPAKVMDFGVARLAGGTTTGGLLVGTPHYMSPEQVRADPALDGRSDLFSVGLILYELVTGERAYRADSLVAVIYKIVNEAPDLSLLPGGAAWGRLRAILARALAKDPALRYPDAHVMADEVATALRELGGRLEPHTAADQILRFSTGGRPAPAPPPGIVEPPLSRAEPGPERAPEGAAEPEIEPDPTEASTPLPDPPWPAVPERPEPSRRSLAVGLAAAVVLAFGIGLVVLVRVVATQVDVVAPSARPSAVPSPSRPPVVDSTSPGEPSPVAVAPEPTPSTTLPPPPMGEEAAIPPTTAAASPVPAAPGPPPSGTGSRSAPAAPTDDVRLERADVYFERGQYAAAAAEARAVLARDPAQVRAREILEDVEVELLVLNALRGAKEAIARGDRAGALAEVRRGLARKPTDGRLTTLRRELEP